MSALFCRWSTFINGPVKNRKKLKLIAGEFYHRYLTCQISAILYADRGDRRNSQSLHRVIFADRRIKSPGVSLALVYEYDFRE